MSRKNVSTENPQEQLDGTHNPAESSNRILRFRKIALTVSSFHSALISSAHPAMTSVASSIAPSEFRDPRERAACEFSNASLSLLTPNSRVGLRLRNGTSCPKSALPFETCPRGPSSSPPQPDAAASGASSSAPAPNRLLSSCSTRRSGPRRRVRSRCFSERLMDWALRDDCEDDVVP